QMQSPEASAIWVAGFSFGAWVAMQLLMRRPEVDRFIVLAPLANKFDFSFLQPCPASGLVVQGDKDGFSNPVSVGNWVRELNMQTDVQAKDIEIVYKIIPGADHFFTNHTDKMIRAVERYVRSVHAPAEPKKKKPPARSSRRKKTSSRSRAS
ncbi:MAG: dienelactone hydrolase family protein, partial [Alphaproteobacteria bacterium]|nr:dienelactone hydrolase family protein [Alphaproteobacteria bacterium]